MNDFENAKRGRGGCHADPNSSEQGANAPSSKQNNFGADLAENVRALKELLPAEDILVYEFAAGDGTACAAVYADGITDKQLLGELAARPLAEGDAPETLEACRKRMLFPEVKEAEDIAGAAEEILAGNPALLIDGMRGALVLGTKKVSLRAVMEPQTAIAIKGPREGFIEDVKTNMGLIRRRLKTPALRFVTLTVGRYSKTSVAIAYLSGVASEARVKEIEARLAAADIDGVPDSSYIARILARRPHSLFKQAGTTEKPDILCAKMLEGRIAVLADGSPIALTLPYMLAEDFQSAQDYFVSPYRATVSRVLRLLAVLASLLLPALYVAAQLFRLRLIPFGLLLIVSGGIRAIPLSPGLEMFFLLAVLEVLVEASVRMPKYVALALSVIGALVLGDTAVKAGLVSSPAIIIVAIAGISAYTVPDLTGTLSLVRILFVVAAGSIGPYGVVLLAALLLWYLVSADSYGVPLLAPFAPLVSHDLRDALIKADLSSLAERPRTLRGKNRRRLRLCAGGSLPPRQGEQGEGSPRRPAEEEGAPTPQKTAGRKEAGGEKGGAGAREPSSPQTDKKNEEARDG